jgi:hypothetical protein
MERMKKQASPCLRLFVNAALCIASAGLHFLPRKGYADFADQ